MPPAALPDCLKCRPGQGSIPLYHLTHCDNLPSIVRARALCADSVCAAAGVGYRRIGDAAIKSLRQRWRVRLPPHGCLGDYVPFYVAPRSPMLLRISSGLVAGYAEGQDQVVYLVSTLAAILAAGLAALFSDGQANHQHSKHFLADMESIKVFVDWPLMTAAVWRSTDDDPQRMRRRQAEVLVHQRLPWGLVQGVAVRRAAIAARVDAVLDGAGESVPVAVRPGWYF